MNDITIAIEILSIVVTVVIVPAVFYWVRSMERRMKDLDSRMRGGVTRDDVKEMIDVKQESVKVMQKELKEDILEVKHTLEKVLDTLISNR